MADNENLIKFIQQTKQNIAQYQRGATPIFCDEQDQLVSRNDLVASTDQEIKKILAILAQRGVKFNV